MALCWGYVPPVLSSPHVAARSSLEKGASVYDTLHPAFSAKCHLLVESISNGLTAAGIVNTYRKNRNSNTCTDQP